MNSLLPKTADTMPPQLPSELGEKRAPGANQVIIQCPSCQTKFALDRSYLSGIENPKFHCSRCDHVFRPEVDEAHFQPVKVHGPTTKSQIRPELIVSPKIKEGAFEPMETAAHEESTQDESDSSSGEFDFAGMYDDLAEAPSALKPSDFSVSSKSYAPSIEVEPPPTPQPHITSKDFVIHAPKEGDRVATVNSSSSETAHVPHTPPAGRVLMSHQPQAEINQISELREQQRLRRPFSAARIFKRMSQKCNGPIVYLTPLAIVMVTLIVFASSARVNPERVNSIVTSVIPSLFEPTKMMVPPPGIFVKQSQLKMVTLQDGARVPLLVGRVVNTTSSPVAGVMVEGIGFDSNARAVVSKRAPIRSELAREKPEFLTRETVSRLETVAPLRRQTLEPGETAEFAVVLESLADTEAIRYYSARIFSVH